MASSHPVAHIAAETFLLPGCKVPLRVVAERRPRSRHRCGVELIINTAHRDMVLAVKAEADSPEQVRRSMGRGE